MAIIIEVITNGNRLLKEAVPYSWLGNIYERINDLSIPDSERPYPFGSGQHVTVTFLTYLFRSNHRGYIAMKRIPNSSFYHFPKFHFGIEI